MTAVKVRPADDSDVEAMAAIYVNAARTGWANSTSSIAIHRRGAKGSADD